MRRGALPRPAAPPPGECRRPHPARRSDPRSREDRRANHVWKTVTSIMKASVIGSDRRVPHRNTSSVIRSRRPRVRREARRQRPRRTGPASGHPKSRSRSTRPNVRMETTRSIGPAGLRRSPDGANAHAALPAGMRDPGFRNRRPCIGSDRSHGIRRSGASLPAPPARHPKDEGEHICIIK
jgi:hypothetical protein